MKKVCILMGSTRKNGNTENKSVFMDVEKERHAVEFAQKLIFGC